MLSLSYFWTYIFASLFSFILLRVYKGFNGSSQALKTYLCLMGALTQVALLVFLIIGFWYMPEWWYPLVFFGCAFILKMIPIPDYILMLIGIIAAPVLTVLSYILLLA